MRLNIRVERLLSRVVPSAQSASVTATVTVNRKMPEGNCNDDPECPGSQFEWGCGFASDVTETLLIVRLFLSGDFLRTPCLCQHQNFLPRFCVSW
ncbi:MAG TPA: hypothetical protein DCG12_08305 [Planctomycetaceae bacterium]|nr:hypothetical protein [Planctomycetaceae bacterium]